MQIDIGTVVEQKAKRKIARPIKWLLEKIIHQREINNFFRLNQEKKGLDFLKAILDYFDIHLEVKNKHLLPEDSRCIFVSNHPLGGIDGIALLVLLIEQYGTVRFLANDMLSSVEAVREYFLPVNTYGPQSAEQVDALENALKSDLAVASFPAGYCSRYIDGQVQDRTWKKSFIPMAVKSHRNIVPIHFIGENSKHFYWIDRIRRFLGVKFDLATALLPDEMFRTKSKTFQIVIGEPLPWQSYEDNALQHQELAQQVKDLIYSLH